MSWNVIEKNWRYFRAGVKRKWAALTEADLDSIDGHRDELAARLGKRYGIEKLTANREIEDWMREPGVLDDWNDQRPILDM